MTHNVPVSKGIGDVYIYNYIFTILYNLFLNPEEKGEVNIVSSNWLKYKNNTNIIAKEHAFQRYFSKKANGMRT